MRRRHDEWYLFSRDLFLVHCVGIVILHANGRLHWTRHGRVLHHLPQLADIVCTVISILRPDIQKIIEPSVVFRVLLPIVRRSVTQQVNDIGLTGAGQGRKSRRRL